MRACITHVSIGSEAPYYREFLTLEELLDFIDEAERKFGADGVIISRYNDNEWNIQIYDDMIEYA